MKKVITLIISGCLLVGAFGCEDAAKKPIATPKATNTNVPISSRTIDKNLKPIEKSPGVLITTKNPQAKPETQTTSANKSNVDLKTAISQKLQAELPGNKLEVDNKNGEIIISGTANSQAELDKAEKLVKQVKGVKTVTIKAQVKALKKS